MTNTYSEPINALVRDVMIPVSNFPAQEAMCTWELVKVETGGARTLHVDTMAPDKLSPYFWRMVLGLAPGETWSATLQGYGTACGLTGGSLIGSGNDGNTMTFPFA